MADPSASNGQWIEPVVDRWERPLVRYALGITGDLEQARDVVQETFLRLVREEGRQRAVPVHLAAWLFKVCRHRALDVRKKENRMKSLGEERMSILPSSEAPQSSVVEGRDTAAEIAGLLAALPENQREVLRLRFEHELSYREISDVTGLTVTNVGYLLHTAIKTLRSEMKTGAAG
jgi:RNA polymerase sigma factor (sigma-70 family)